jgi:hypothetical protein
MNLLSSHDVNRAVRVLDHDGIDFAAQEPNQRLCGWPRAAGVGGGAAIHAARRADDLLRRRSGAGRLWQRRPARRSLQPPALSLARRRRLRRAAGVAQQDTALLEHYQQLGQLRQQHSFLRTGSWETLLLDDAGLIVYGRKDASGAAIIAVNRSDQDADGQLRRVGLSAIWGMELSDPFGEATLTVSDGSIVDAGLDHIHRAGHELSTLADRR